MFPWPPLPCRIPKHLFTLHLFHVILLHIQRHFSGSLQKECSPVSMNCFQPSLTYAPSRQTHWRKPALGVRWISITFLTINSFTNTWSSNAYPLLGSPPGAKTQRQTTECLLSTEPGEGWAHDRKRTQWILCDVVVNVLQGETDLVPVLARC